MESQNLPAPGGRREATFEAFSDLLDSMPGQYAELLLNHLDDPMIRRVADRLGMTRTQVNKAKAHPSWRECLRMGRELRFRDDDRSDLINELKAIAYADPTEYKFDDEGRPVVEAGREHIWRAVRSVERIRTEGLNGPVVRSKITFWDKNTALKLLAQCLGYLERETRSGEGVPPIIVYGLDLDLMTGKKKALPAPIPLVEAFDVKPPESDPAGPTVPQAGGESASLAGDVDGRVGE